MDIRSQVSSDMNRADAESDALSQGRRIYLGNLHYVIRPKDVEEMLVDKGFGNFENIHISVDPVSARNPGYCFVDFIDKATADRALVSLSANIRGRQLKVGPCEPKKKRAYEDRACFQRWGDWSSASASRNAGVGDKSQAGLEQGPRGAIAHFNDMMDNFHGRRLYVGGLKKMIDQEQNTEEIQAIFANAGFHPEAIGKRITPRPETRLQPGNHHYCFVDFQDVREAQAAMKALDGAPHQGGFLRVSLAKSIPEHLLYRRLDNRSDRQGEADIKPASAGYTSTTRKAPRAESIQPQHSEGLARAMASNDWRRKPAAQDVE